MHQSNAWAWSAETSAEVGAWKDLPWHVQSLLQLLPVELQGKCADAVVRAHYLPLRLSPLYFRCAIHIKHASLPRCNVALGEATLASSFQLGARCAVNAHMCFLHDSRAPRLDKCNM